MVERFNRTLKTRLWKYFTSKRKQRWLDILQDAVHAYNHSVHRMIGRRPVDVGPDMVDEMREREHQRRKPPRGKNDVRVGDKVRISKMKTVFAKGYLPNWTEEIFTVAEVNTKFTPITYKLKDYQGDIIEGSFYREEIEPIIKEDDVYLVERVIRQRQRQGVMWVLVKWLGYPETMNSWIPQSEMVSLT